MNAPADSRAAWTAALAWQVELGADEAIGEVPLDRFEESARQGAPGRAGKADPAPEGQGEAPAMARKPAAPRPAANPAATDAATTDGAIPAPADLAASAATLAELAEVMRNWPGSPLRESARNMVFSDGLAGARLMVIGEAPGASEDRQGKPFVGRAGHLLDLMLAAIGLSRTAPAPESAVYITNILPWRPPGNRTPSEAETRAFLPFIERHIELARPDILMTVGNTPTKALLGTVTGIRRMRGTWARHAASGLPVMPCFHPAYLLRTPAEKRQSWRDLLAVRHALDGERP